MQRHHLISLGVILVATAAVFSPALGFGPIRTWDDSLFVILRPEILDWWGASWADRLTNPSIGYPVPLPTALYAWLSATFGQDGYFGILHGVHLAFHMLNVALVYGLTRRWTTSNWAPAFVAAIWALHPLHAEVIGWLTNTKTVLGGTFILAALAFQELRDAKRLPGPAAAVLVTLSFGLAIGSRPDAAILPFVLGAVSLALGRREKGWLTFLGGLGALAIPYVLWAGSMHAGAIDAARVSGTSVSETIYRIGRAFEMQVAHILLPFDLHPAYFRGVEEGLLDSLPGWAMIVLGLGACAWAWRNGAKTAVAGAALFAVAYAPYANVVFIPRMMGDTYAYLPLFGFLVAIAGALETRESTKPRTMRIITALLASGLAALTFSQIQRWENDITLWAPLLEAEPEAEQPYRHLAFYHYLEKDIPNALELAKAGLPHFQREKEIPWFVVAIFRDAGDPVQAANIGIQALKTNRWDDPEVGRTVLETLVATKLPLPADPSVRETIREAASAYLANPKWMANPQVGPAFGAYFLNNGEQDVARRFLEHAATSPNAPCDLWTWMPSLANRPDRCP